MKEDFCGCATAVHCDKRGQVEREMRETRKEERRRRTLKKKKREEEKKV